MGVGLERMTRLVTQMLALARADSAAIPSGTARVHWPAIVAEAMSDCLPLAERRHVELACDWPPAGRPALPLRGDEQALTVLLRNLIDNAIRYGPEGSTVTVVFDADRLTVENLGAPLTASQLQRMGERFHRDGGQAEAGNGLGVSIVQRIAAMHGLSLRYGAMANGQGVRATLLNGAAADHLEGEGMST